MNLQDQVIYRCIHAACARTLPRKVNFCPYCGTGQHAGVEKPAHARPPAAPPAPPPAPVKVEPVAPVVLEKPAAAPPPPPAPPPAAPPKSSAPQPPARPPAAPPRREPISKRWWLVAVAALWLIWIYAKPSGSKVERRIAAATEASAECRLNDAQSELIALRMSKATPEQLSKLQATINTAAVGCNKKKQRVKAWDDTVIAVSNALADGDFTRASARLSQFTRRWEEDAETRKLRDKIAAQRATAAPGVPMAPVIERSERPRPLPGAQSQSARNLIDEAERALQAGDYRAASDKLETCITMVDAGNRECAAFKVHADRMLVEQQRCLSAGRQWVADRCR